jgi:hypothetical protein
MNPQYAQRFPSSLGRLPETTVSYARPQAMPGVGEQLGELGRVLGPSPSYNEDPDSMLRMLHSLYGISADQQERPEHLRGERLRNDATEQELPLHLRGLQQQNEGADLENQKRRFEQQWAQPNAEQEYNARQANIDLATGAKAGEVTPKEEMDFYLHTGKPYPGGQMEQRQKQEQSQKEWGDLQDRYTKGIGTPDDEQVAMQHFGPQNVSYLQGLHPEAPEVQRLRASVPPQYQNDPDFQKQIQQVQAHTQHPGFFDSLSPEQAQRQVSLDDLNRQTHPAIQFLKDLFTAYD